jgi:hypothetical protein
MKRICIVGISGKLGQYMLQHALAAGYEVRGVCRPESVAKLAAYQSRITLFPGRSDDRAVMEKALAGCDGVLCVLVPWGVNNYATNTAQAVLDFAPKNARLVFSCGWHISLDGKDRYSWHLRALVALFGPIARLFRIADLDDQVRACNTVFASSCKWTVVRGSDLEEGDSEGLPLWAEHVGDPILALNRTRRIDFALFMVTALTDDGLIGKAPAIVSRRAAVAADQPVKG